MSNKTKFIDKALLDRQNDFVKLIKNINDNKNEKIYAYCEKYTNKYTNLEKPTKNRGKPTSVSPGFGHKA